ncbi:ccr4-not transcription complex subunit 1 [Babesia gibsoni]|uniref:Ccr4-not transcription complex subunit 1 n=1 Tax=Babesia gibsoni TaxID=33632 RepID=A0AAD8LSQ4_BABGI|nr:ccr4-not transcription complex subunit 1 [Babesia gibsoni]
MIFTEGSSDHEPSARMAAPVQVDDFEALTDEERVNKYFYKLYVAEITTDQMIEVMRYLEECPPNSKNRETYRTMLKILFNECRFFPKYPVQELAITAELFGKMIKHGLLLSNGNLLMLALRCIIEALKRGKASKMFQFGTIALSQFENSIANYPWFSTALLEIADVRETFPQLYRTCEKLQNIMTEYMHGTTYIDQARGIVIRPDDSQKSQDVSLKSSSEPRHQVSAMSMLNKDRIDVGEMENLMNGVIEDFNVVPPPGVVVNQIYAAFNNMSLDTAPQKAFEVKDVISSDNCFWLLLYIIKTRASKEQNLHEVFVTFIENLRLPKLFELAIQITYACVSACLSRILEFKDLPAYRTMLKNLGSWLGRITLGRNVPIMSRHLDIKQVMFHAYENGAMVAALPFVCKAMEHIKHSKIFKPPNPWTTAILSFLVEIHSLPGLKTSLVFEVEVLLKHLELDLFSFGKMTNLLGSRTRPEDSGDFDNTIQLKLNDHQENIEDASPIAAQIMVGMSTREQKMLLAQGRQSPPLSAKDRKQETVKEKLNLLLSKAMWEGQAHARTSAPPHDMRPGEGYVGYGHGMPEQKAFIQANMPVQMMPMQQQAVAAAENPVTLPVNNFGEQLLQKLHNSVIVSNSIAIFGIHPQLRVCIPFAIERAVRRVLPVISDHALSIARSTTKAMISKDFVGEDNKVALRAAIHSMMDFFATSLVLATCKEPLRIAFHESLRAALMTYRTQESNDKMFFEQLVQVVSQDNLLPVIAVVEKIVAERVSREADIILMDILKLSKNYHKPQVALPPVLQQWNNTKAFLDKRHFMIYQNLFQNNVSRRAISAYMPVVQPQIQMPPNVCSGAISRFEECFAEVREPLRGIALFPPLLYTQHPMEPGYEHIIFSTHALLVLYSLPVDHDLFACIEQCLSVMENSKHMEAATVSIAHRLLMFLCEGLGAQTGLNVEVLLCVLDGLNRLNRAVKQAIASVIFSMPLDRSNNIFNVITITGLLRYELLDWTHLAHYLTLAMDKGRNMYAVELSIVITAIAVVDQRSVPPDRATSIMREIAAINCGQETCETYPGILLKDARAKLLNDYMEMRPENRTTIASLTPILKRNLAACIAPSDFQVVCPSSKDDSLPLVTSRDVITKNQCFGGVRRVCPPPPIADSHRAIVSIIFAKWIECSLQHEGDYLLMAWRQFFQRFNLQSLFKMDGGTDNFFAICVGSAISTITTDGSMRMTSEQIGSSDSSNDNLDGLVALAKMAHVMLRLVGGSDVPPTSALQKVLASTSSLIIYNEQLMAYYKLWVVMIDYFDRVESENGQIVCRVTFLNGLEMINPTRAPVFCYYWLKLLSHRTLLPGCMSVERCWSKLGKLFLYMTCFLQANEHSDIDNIENAFYEVVVQLCKSYPDFIVEYYFCFGGSQRIERLVGSCQLSGETVKLPTPGASIDHIPAMGKAPKIPHMMVLLLSRHAIKSYVDVLLRMMIHQNHMPNTPPINIYSVDFERLVAVLEELILRDPGQSLTLLTSLTYYIGIKFNSSLPEPTPMDESRLYLYLDLIRSMSALGKHLFMRAICRHLRFPNMHTQFFSCLVLWMYDALKSPQDEMIRQVMLRALLEHFLNPMSCPWGIKLTVLELFRNPRFKLNGGSFQAISGRVQSLLDAVSLVCADI